MNTETAVKRVHIIQGEYKVISDPVVVLSTILGSCVAACLRDPIAGVGGMNHFLLPGNASSPSTGGAPLPPGAMINSFSDLVGMSCSIPLLRKNGLPCFHV